MGPGEQAMMASPDPLTAYVARRTGIELSRGGLLTALESYVEKRSAELGVASREDYLERLDAADGAEFERLIEIISVPHTWFFRDLGQMEAVGQVLKQLAQPGRPLRIWIPACATGEDPYTLALITLQQGIPAQITASDLCSRSLRFARAGRYGNFSLRDLPRHYLRYFHRSPSEALVHDDVKRVVHFQIHNLLKPPLVATDGWDLILCRNVLIYFSVETGLACTERLGHSLHPRGLLALGAGELIGQPPRGLTPQLIHGRVFFSRTTTPLPTAQKLPTQATAPAPPTKRSGISRGEPTSMRRPPSAPPPQEAIDAAAVALLAPGEPSKIAADVLKHSMANPLQPLLRMISGIALYAAGDFRYSQNELRAALLLEDRLWPAALYHGLCLESMGQPELARTEYLHAARLLRTEAPTPLCLPPALRTLEPDLLELARLKTRALLE